jgi:putative FmdB family regulatory protein
MPTYEYLCSSCNHRFERWQKMSDEPVKVCPECGQGVRRVLYPAGVVFKGSGFYVTDHSKSSHAAANGTPSSTTDEAPKAESATSAEKPSESKPASTASSSSSAAD